MVRRRRTTTPGGPRGNVDFSVENYISQKSLFHSCVAYGFRNSCRGRRRRDPWLNMALVGRSPSCLLGRVNRSAALLDVRWLQPQTWLGLLDSWGLPATQPNRGKARGNEYQPSNIKRKHKHGWIKRLSTPAGVQVILRRMLKGRKSLSH